MTLRQYWGLLATYLTPQKWWITLLALLLFSGIGLELAGPQILRLFIDTATTKGTLNTLLTLGILFLVVALLTQGVLIVETYVAERVGWTATNQLRADLMLHCLLLDRTFHQTHTPGELIERIDGDVTKLGTFFSRMVIQLAGNLLLLAGIIALSFGIDWRVGSGMAGFALIALIILQRMRNVGVKQWERERQSSADLFGFIEERLSGTEDLRAAGATSHTLRQLARRTLVLLRMNRRAILAGAATWNTMLLLLALGIAASLALGVWLYSMGAITIGAVYLIYSYTDLLRRPIEDLSRQVQELQEATASIGRIQGLLAMTNALTEGNGPPLPDGALSVAFHGVDFAYVDSDDLVLHDISLAIPAGMKLGIIGRTGSGKTTLSRLLFRLHDPTRGVVLLGSTDIREPPIAEVRRRIGLVSQDIQLFHASVRDNLTFFDRSIADARIIAILAELGLDTWYQRLLEGLDTKLAPDGSGLSAGEAQLLAFARVFLQDPGVIVLDEPSSRLDLATEQIIERAIDRLMAGRTGIIIAHRLATLQRVDAILLLDHGRLREYGPREALARDQSSQYAQLLRAGLEEALA